MPELPEVESIRKYCQDNILDKEIQNVEVENSRVVQEPKNK